MSGFLSTKSRRWARARRREMADTLDAIATYLTWGRRRPLYSSAAKDARQLMKIARRLGESGGDAG